MNVVKVLLVLFSLLNGKWVKSAEASSEEIETTGTVDAIDSDYIFLYIAKSTLPWDQVGNGVFAKFDLPANELLCEYRGPAILDGVEYHSPNKFRTTAPDGTVLNIISESICSMVNDAAKIVDNNYSEEDINAFATSDREDIIPTYEGFGYNAHFVFTKLGKVLLYSSSEIKADTEIFFSYGRNYWIPSLLQLQAQKAV